ncbi:MAG: TonB-dependent receptor [Bacteroidota bacterium]
MKIYKALFTAILFILSFSILSQNNDTVDLFDLPIEDLLNIKIITSAKIPEKILETSTSIQVITKKEIQFLNFNTLQEVLEYATGMSSINGEANFFTTTTIRGNTLVNYNTNTLLLFDGVPILNAYHGSFDFQAIPLSSIEKIEIVKGSNSVLYGTNAINAVINVISIKKDNLDKNPVSLSGKLRYGSYNTLHGESSILYNNENVSFSLFTDLNYSDGEKLTFNDELGNILSFHKKYKGNSVATNLKYKGLTLHFQFYNRAEPAVRTREFNRMYTNVNDTIGILVTEPSDELMTISSIEYNYSFTDRTELHLRSNNTMWKNIKTLPDSFWEYSANGFYNDIELSYIPSDKWKNIAGISYNHFIGRRYKSQIGQYDVGKDNIWTNEFAAYLNGNIEFLKRLNFFYGGRYFVSKYSDVILDNFSPRIALTYKPIKLIALKFIYGNSFRVPTYFEKEVFSENVVGNPNLLPERSKSFDFVVMGIYKGFQMDINVFHTQIIDQIKRVDSPDDPDMKTNMNIGTSRYCGIELNTKFIIKNHFHSFAGYAYAKGCDTDIGEPNSFTYNHMINLGLNWKIMPQLSFSSSLKHLSDWGAAPSYTLLNTGLNVKPFKHTPLHIELKADNILDTKVLRPEIARVREPVPTYPLTMSRKFFVGVSFEF